MLLDLRPEACPGTTFFSMMPLGTTGAKVWATSARWGS